MNTATTHTVVSNPHPTTLHGAVALTHLGVIKITGEDAAKFIHGQLTQDFSLLGAHEARLAAFCSAKGRMQASFIGFKRTAGEILLVCSADLLAATLKRLSMFVMRAKAKLSDATHEYAVYGLAGAAIQELPSHADVPWSKFDLGDISVIQLYPANGIARQMWIGPAGAAPAGGPLSLDLWHWGEVRSAVATVTTAVVEAFVPQMLNYESVGGVNFKKGCYPGQEVVARSQFRGTLKRRAFVVHSSAAMQAGDEIFGPADTDQPVATVVQSAAAPEGGFDAIISAQLSAIEVGDMHLSGSTGAALTVLPLPYPLLEDV